MKIREEREELTKMIKNSPDSIGESAEPANEDILQPEPIMNVDFDDLKERCEKEARLMIKNAISFMIPVDMISENKYLKDKFKVDVMSLAGMIYQLRSNEIMQKALMDQINHGLTHPRYWEVYTGMSKTIGELNKQLIQTTEALKETYRSFKEDAKEKKTEALGTTMHAGMLTTGDGSVVTRGTKELINRVKEAKAQRNNGALNNEITDAKIVSLPDEFLDNDNIENFS